MIIPDSEITKRIQATPSLISNHDPVNVRNCGYTLRVSKAFQPESPDLLSLQSAAGRPIQNVWRIGPSETLVVMTQEVINMPDDLCGVYAPLHRLAKQGILLLNASIVEPRYSGPLSCFLVNFSSQAVYLSEGESVTKITFHSLSAKPNNPVPLSISPTKYERDLIQDTSKFTRSFLDVSGIEERASKKAQEGLRKSIALGGVFVAVLLLWASLEPLISGWIWKRQGLPTTLPERVEYVKLLKDLEVASKSFEAQKETRELQEQIRLLQATVKELQEKAK
jgi:deoxycytidine triphosphate deaminase